MATPMAVRRSPRTGSRVLLDGGPVRGQRAAGHGTGMYTSMPSSSMPAATKATIRCSIFVSLVRSTRLMIASTIRFRDCVFDCDEFDVVACAMEVVILMFSIFALRFHRLSSSLRFLGRWTVRSRSGDVLCFYCLLMSSIVCRSQHIARSA